MWYIGIKHSPTFVPEYLGSGVHLRHAIRKYGVTRFKCEPIEWCHDVASLKEAERRWIAKLDAVNDSTSYNLAAGGDGMSLGSKNAKPRSPEHRERIRLANLGQKRSEESKRRMSIAAQNRDRATRRVSKETAKKIAESNRRAWEKRSRVMPEAVKEKISNACKGRRKPPRTEEHARKIGEANLGRKTSEETKQKLSLASLGKPKSEEQRANMRAGWVKRRARQLQELQAASEDQQPVA